VTFAACATATSDQSGVDGDRQPADADAAPASSPDAEPHQDPPDAMPVEELPDAGPVEPPCTVQTINLLHNASFDNGVGGWTQSSSGGYQLIMNQSETGITAHSGVQLGWLGGYDDAVDSLSQNLAIPADATNVTVTGQRYFTTDESGGSYDKTWLDITDAGGGTQLEQLAQWSNGDATGAWVAFSFAPSGNYQGQTINVRLRSDSDYSNPSWFFYDTLRLQLTTCQ